MTRDAGPERATRAVRAVRTELNARGWIQSDLARRAGLNPDTAATFLNATRKPHLRTHARIEAALGWPPGTLDAINDGADRVTLQLAEIHISRLSRNS